LDREAIRSAAVDVELSAASGAEVTDCAVEAMIGQVRAERPAQTPLVVDDPLGRHAPLAGQLDHDGLEAMPGVVEYAMPLGGEESQELLAVADNDDGPVRPDSSTDVDTHAGRSRRVITPEFVVDDLVLRARV